MDGEPGILITEPILEIVYSSYQRSLVFGNPGFYASQRLSARVDSSQDPRGHMCCRLRPRRCSRHLRPLVRVSIKKEKG